MSTYSHLGCDPVIPEDAYMASTIPDAIESDIDGDESKVKEVWCLQICPFREAELLEDHFSL